MGAVILILALAAQLQGAVTSVSLATTRFDDKNATVADDRVIGTRTANVRHVIGRSSESGYEIVLGGSGTYSIARQYTGSGCTDGTDATGAHNAHVLNRLSGTVGTDRVFIKPIQKGDTNPTSTPVCTIILSITDDTPSTVDYTFTFNWSYERRIVHYQTNFNRRPDAQQNCSIFNTNWEDTRGACTALAVWPNMAETPVGGKRVDDVTGAVVQRVTPVGTKHLYTAKSFNIDGTLTAIKYPLMPGTLTGTYSTVDYTRKNAKFSGFFSPSDPNTWYNTKQNDGGSGSQNAELHKYVLSGTTVTETTIYTWPVANEWINSGDNAQQSADGTRLVIPFWTQNQITGERGSVCLLQVEPSVGTPVCYDFGDHPFGRPDGTDGNGNLAFVAGPDKDGYHYVVYYGVWDPGSALPTQSKSAGMIFYGRLGTDAELTMLPATAFGLGRPEDPCCSPVSPGGKSTWGLHAGPNGENAYYNTGGHGAATCDGSGDCWWMSTTPIGLYPGKDSGNQNQNPGARNLTVLRESYQGTSYTHLGLELGGPWTRVGTFDRPDYYNCAFLAQQVCVISEWGGGRQGYSVTNATLAAGNMTLTLTTAWGSGSGYADPNWTPGTSVEILDVGGITNANGTFSVSSVSGNTVTVACASCSGTYTSGGSVLARAIPSEKTNPNTDMIQAVRWGGRDFGAFHYRILAMIHTVCTAGASGADVYQDPYNVCNAFGHVSGDGKWAIYGENEGVGNHTSVFRVPTGFDLDANTPINHFDRHGRGFEINGRVLTLHRTRGHCAVEYGANRDFTSTTTIQMPPGVTQAKLTMTGGTKYYFRAVCDNFDVGVKAVTASTLPGSGTTDITVSGRAPAAATKMVVEFGDTAAFGSGAEVACTAGNTCTATITGNKSVGAVYYGVKWVRVDETAVKREPTRIERIQ